ncbi:Guanine nucleotide-binding protein alpha-2 subunit [Yamadazyma tenuis]|uniref:G-alpha-domain-containing protein n=1 Tax=Candida tenuis (strain ATCC 10573 / BCRC 21748 / CBS 615 / JCM 9827 / NBRC 10315 / NRRL Y-1498 / VKM Y-70) TaxID=590646 RepID=G3B5X7_CANTC|nr:G-alpha-domain-containing protein [Yamadazyma tenuis ATCC 10573]EGV63329.1 G-alpha-domain-containing protein [Yamadazyma tenuis ATCC 10573]WEJ96851.1 Guanine nucleotide-binding protein alpha-2 subunit [Yamadazyma tenuis]
MGACVSKSSDAPAGSGAQSKVNTNLKASGQSHTNTTIARTRQSEAVSGPVVIPATKEHNNSSDSSNDDSTRYNEKNQLGNSESAGSGLPTGNNNQAGNQLNKEVKVLLLGSGESGKSTIVKQMKILHQNGYSKEELLEYKPFVYKNVMDCIKSIINAIVDLEPQLIRKVEDASEKDKDDTLLSYNDLNDILDYEVNINSKDPFNEQIALKINKAYSNPKVKEFIKYHSADFYLIDSSNYFLSDIMRITKKNYIPTTNDILRTRKKTSGIYDFRFSMGPGLPIHMYDVGGQRSERKKWIHCFDNVTLIIFCVALSEYDQVLLEENSQNRLEESLTLFDSVVNSRWFARTSIVLFLNKIDVFAEKLPYSPLENYFPDYSGGNNINKAAKYILWRFTQVSRSGLNIYPHVTQATDTSNIELVFAAVKETILENSLKDSGLL